MSCYDAADRLIATTVTNPNPGATPVTGTSLSTAGATLAYDSHGNTVALADQTLTFDVANRHTATTVGATTVTYTRDATDRIVARAATGEPTMRYGFTADGDSPDLVLDPTGALRSRTLVLAGGVVVSLPTSGTATYAYPNIHGDLVTTAGHHRDAAPGTEAVRPVRPAPGPGHRGDRHHHRRRHHPRHPARSGRQRLGRPTPETLRTRQHPRRHRNGRPRLHRRPRTVPVHRPGRRRRGQRLRLPERTRSIIETSPEGSTGEGSGVRLALLRQSQGSAPFPRAKL